MAAKKSGKQPNILVIFGDDIGIPQISAYTRGLMGYQTPNIDRNALRYLDWKVSFATQQGNIATGVRSVSAWALIANLRMDPYERGLEEGGGAIDFLARNMWLLVPIQAQIKKFFSDFHDYSYQVGSSLNAGGINYAMLKQQEALKRLKDVETFATIGG